MEPFSLLVGFGVAAAAKATAVHATVAGGAHLAAGSTAKATAVHTTAASNRAVIHGAAASHPAAWHGAGAGNQASVYGAAAGNQVGAYGAAAANQGVVHGAAATNYAGVHGALAANQTAGHTAATSTGAVAGGAAAVYGGVALGITGMVVRERLLKGRMVGPTGEKIAHNLAWSVERHKSAQDRQSAEDHAHATMYEVEEMSEYNRQLFNQDLENAIDAARLRRGSRS
jgi:hypothetical protein